MTGGWREQSTSFLRVLTFCALRVEMAAVNDSWTRHSQLGNRLGSMHGADAELIARVVNDAVIAHVAGAENLDDDVTLVIVSRAMSS